MTNADSLQSKTILLLGARAPVTLDLARALQRAGHRVLGAESLRHALSKNSSAFDRFFTLTAPNESFDSFKTELLALCRHEQVQILIPTCEEVFHVAKIKNELEQIVPWVWVDDFSKLSRLHSKYEFNTWMRSSGFAAPPSERVTSASAALGAIQSIPGQKIVLKPEFSRFAAQTLVLKKDTALARVQHLDLNSHRAWVVQQAIQGPEYCTYSLFDRGQLLAHVTYAHAFTAGQGAGICFEEVSIPEISSWIQRFGTLTQYHGQVAFDFMIDDSGTPYPLECNPRATSGLHLLVQDPRFLRAIAHPLAVLRDAAIYPSPGTLAQIRLAMLVYGLPSVHSWRRFFEWLKIFTRAREVVFSWQDGRPFWDQFVSLYFLIQEARLKKMTPLEVSTQDIEFNGVQP